MAKRKVKKIGTIKKVADKKAAKLVVKKPAKRSPKKTVAKSAKKTKAVKIAGKAIKTKVSVIKTVLKPAIIVPAVKKSEITKSLHPSHIFKKFDGKLQNFYGDTRIVLLPRDPYWLFTYWEVSLPRIKDARSTLGSEFKSSKSILRIYEVTNIDFNGANAHGYFDITLENLMMSWYINVYAPEKSWVVDIGMLTVSGKFFVLARSNAMTTPADSMSNQDYEEWMDSSESWKMYMVRAGGKNGIKGANGIYGSDSEARVFDATSMSGGVSSLSSPVKYEKKPSAFWMRVGTELIVYGATEPDAKVTINSSPVALNKDGSFSTRFALTDGVHTLNITGRSVSGQYKKTFKITVTQDTKKDSDK